MLGVCRCDLYVNTRPRETSVSGPNRPNVCWRFFLVRDLVGYTVIWIMTPGAHQIQIFESLPLYSWSSDFNPHSEEIFRDGPHFFKEIALSLIKVRILPSAIFSYRYSITGYFFVTVHLIIGISVYSKCLNNEAEIIWRSGDRASW